MQGVQGVRALSTKKFFGQETQMKIQGKTALITGANRGIGREIAIALLANGAKKIYATARDPQSLRSLQALDPARIVPLQLDVTDLPSIQAAAAASDVNLLFNNAAVLEFGDFLETPTAQVSQMFMTNFFGMLDMTRIFTPILEAHRDGAIVNILSLVALASMPSLTAYNASKAAAWSLTQSIRATLANKKIEVFGVFPGAVDTDMLAGVDMPKARPQEIANAILRGIENGTEDIFPDVMSQSLYAAWRIDHKAVEKQFASM